MNSENEQLLLRWGVLDNHLDGGFSSRLTLINNTSAPLESEWTIYFNFLRVVDSESVTPPLAIEHVNGDLFRIRPRDNFGSLPPGDSVQVEFRSAAWAVGATDGPAGAYIVIGDELSAKPTIKSVGIEIEPFLDERQTDRGPGDNKPVQTPALDYARNSAITSLPPANVMPITPTPTMLEWSDGEFKLSAGLSISAPEELQGEAELLADRLFDFIGIAPAVSEFSGDDGGLIRLRLQEATDANLSGANDERYTLLVDPTDGIDIVGSSAAGVFYGIQSLLALIDPPVSTTAEATVGAVRIMDAPRFGYRGMHLDVARNFQTKESVLKLLDVMSFYKLNRFHFHLTDDEGWRLEIAGLPELTDVGAFRGHTATESDHLVPSFGSGPDPDPRVSNGSGFYSREEYKEILRFAHARHIEVIPEIDVPGHARAAIVSMKERHRRLMAAGQEDAAVQYMLTHPDDESKYMSVQHWNDNVMDVCMSSTYEFLEHVVQDIVDMYREAGVPLATIHTGGDEVPAGVWSKSPACAELAATEGDRHLPSYFLNRLNNIISGHGLVTAGWEEVALYVDEAGGHSGKEPDVSLLGKSIRPYVWNSIWGAGSEELGYRLANAGFEIVLSSASNLYFDLAYDKHPEEPGYYWAGYVDTRKPFELEPYDLYRSGTEDLMGNPISQSIYSDKEVLTDRGRSNILGIQGQLWSENAKGSKMMDYLVFPKLIGLAERAWAPQPSWSKAPTMRERDSALDAAWNEFANRLGSRELPRLDVTFGGVGYRIPPPGAVIEGSLLKANVAFPGLEIRYTTDGSRPEVTSALYTGPVEVSGSVRLRTFNRRGRGSRVVRVDV
jgi:hexosaminidase